MSVFFFPFIVYCFRCLLLFFYFSLFLLFIMPLKLIKLQTPKNVGLVIIQRVVMRCSIEGRQKTVSNSLVSISEIKANLWLSAFWFVYCTCICCGSDLIFGLNFLNLGTNNGGDFPQESLLAIYNRIKKVCTIFIIIIKISGWILKSPTVYIPLNSSPIDELGRWCLHSWWSRAML